MSREVEPGYAIVRIDEFQSDDVSPEHKITVKRIVWSQEVAEAEVERLNSLNQEKGCRYFWQYTRVDRRE